MEIVLGIDNIVFLSLLVAKVPKEKQAFTRTTGLILALGTRLLLLLSISWVMSLKDPLFAVFGKSFSGRDIILFGGGAFLVGKATHEIFEKLEVETEEESEHDREKKKGGRAPLAFVLVQIAVIDIVFSLDSVITAVGMAQHVSIMMAAMIIAVLVMILFAGKVGEFVTRHPSMTVLALSFLILIGVMLVADALGQHVSKGYVYSAMAFSLFVEVLNMRFRKKKAAPVKLHSQRFPKPAARE
ncbi:MAG: TerC family protein [Polyangiaceae bacterium]|nr:TerC family protein [Polyangiaceae bacterium]